MSIRKTSWILALALVGFAGEAAAQATGMPAYYAPYRSFDKNELGVTVSFPDYDQFAAEGLFGFGFKQFDLEARGGIYDPGEGVDTQVRAGLQGRARVVTHNEDFPLDGAVTAGFGVWFNGFSTALIPIGFSLGRRLNVEDSEVSIVPYVHPVGMIVTAGTDHFAFGFGLGADFKLTSKFDARLSVAFGDAPLKGFAISAVWVN